MISLKKGDGINLTKDHDCQRAIVEVTFDVHPNNSGRAHEYEINVCAFELDHNNPDNKPIARQDESFVFFNNKMSPDGAIVHDVGGGSTGEDKLTIDFSKLDTSPLKPDEVSNVVEIYEGRERGHTFGQFTHCTAFIVNADTGERIANFRLDGEDSNATSVQMGSFVKEGGHWHFKAIGAGYQKGLAEYLHAYGLQESVPE